MPKEYPAEFKAKIIKRYQKGESIQSLSQELHIAQSTLYDWRREYCSIKTANRTYTPKEFDTLSRRLEKLEHELEIIRLTGYILNVPLQKKLVFLESLYQKPDNPYSVYELCEALDVARGTFYNHIFRRADRSKRDQEQARLMRLVQQVFDDSAQRFGAEKIRIALTESGIRVSTNASRRSCKSLICTASAQTQKSNSRSVSSTKNRIYWSSSSPRSVPTKSGSAILHTSKSTTTGSTFV